MYKGLLVFLLVTLCGLSDSEAARRRRPKPKRKPPKIEFDFRLDSFALGQYRQIADTIVNPNNTILKIPDLSGSVDLRPEFRLSAYNDVIRTTIRPRLVAEYLSIPTGENAERNDKTELTADLTDAYAEIRIADPVRLTAGLEVYQWGPSELYNASNPIFHLRTASRSAFFKEKGEVLGRLGVDATSNWNTMLIANPLSNNEPAWRAGDEDFNASGLIKTELTAENPANYVGLVLGLQPDERKFFGEYFNYGWESGFSVYLDARHPIGKRRFTPVEDELFNIELRDTEKNGTIETLGIAGVRWEGRVDVRLEYLYNSQGFSRDEFDLALRSLKNLSVYLPTNYQRFLQPGLEILGLHTLYFSARISDLGPSSDASIFVRSLFSLQDSSATLQLAGEKPLSDSVVLNLEGNIAYGPDDSEFTLIDRYQAIVGLKWTL